MGSCFLSSYDIYAYLSKQTHSPVGPSVGAVTVRDVIDKLSLVHDPVHPLVSALPYILPS